MLLVAGGLSDVARFLLPPAIAPAFADPRLVMIAVNLTPPLVIAIGCFVLSTSYRGRGRLGLLIAGVFGALLVAINAIQIVTGSPFGPAPSQLAWVSSHAATLAGAALLLSDRTLSGPPRWAFAIPAGCTLVFVAGMFVTPWSGLLFLPALGYVVAGVLLLSAADGPASVAGRRSGGTDSSVARAH